MITEAIDTLEEHINKIDASETVWIYRYHIWQANSILQYVP